MHNSKCQRRWLLILMATTLILCYYYADSFFLSTNSHDVSPGFRQPLPMADTSEVARHFLIHTPTCSIPEFDPDHPSIIKFKKPHKKIVCGKKRPLTSVSGLTLRLHREHLIDYAKAKDQKQLTCYYEGIQRIQQNPNNYTADADKKERLLKKVYLVSDVTEINEDGILVTCTIKKEKVSTIYKNVHTFMQPRRANIKKERFQKAGGWSGNPDMLNLVIIGTDSTSRLNLLRLMPKTYKYLTEELGALDFRGLNKVGDNTDPNLGPALMKEFKNLKICHPKRESKYDDCPLIWKDYSNKGYVTGYAEDAPWMGLFHYKQTGYVKEPTDYYNRPYFRVSVDHISHIKHNSAICQGNKLSLEVIRDWNLDFLAANKDVPVFSFAWSAAITHDYLDMASLADEPHLIHLQTLRNYGYLNNSIIVFMSDHGIRFGSIRETYVGKLEERLPYLLMVLPPWFREKYPIPWYNMAINTRRLVTFFDMHSTFKAILDQDYANQNLSEYKIGTGQSLFLEVPMNRTCNSAGIPQHFCTCEETEEVDPSTYEVQQAAQFVVKTLNEGLKNFPLCAQLNLTEVTGARFGKPNKSTKPKDGDSGVVHRYQITFSTKPGGALFEATLRKEIKEFKMSSEASRINQYGNQSHCIDDLIYRKYCYCNNLLT